MLYFGFKKNVPKSIFIKHMSFLPLILKKNISFIPIKLLSLIIMWGDETKWQWGDLALG